MDDGPIGWHRWHVHPDCWSAEHQLTRWGQGYWAMYRTACLLTVLLSLIIFVMSSDVKSYDLSWPVPFNSFSFRWYSLHLSDGGMARLSWPGWLVTYHVSVSNHMPVMTQS